MFDLLSNRQWLIAAALVVCLLLGAWLGGRSRRFWMRRRLARQWGHARQGEEQARGWLERHGFTVLDEQVSRAAWLIVDGEESPFTVRADYLVERNGVRAVVEVKTGAVADPSSRGTRRQILEYAWVYGVTEVYLFDADAQRLHGIGIPAMPGAAAPVQRTAWPVVVAFSSGVLLGAIAVWWLVR
jgi:Holliday junction resolvase-like predicted endonuclease